MSLVCSAVDVRRHDWLLHLQCEVNEDELRIEVLSIENRCVMRRVES